jgi:hypothetical protein
MTQTILSSWVGRRSNSKAGAWISTLAAAALTADRIDYWIRRYVIQYWHEAHPSQQKLSPAQDKRIASSAIATNKCLAASNKSNKGGIATKERTPMNDIHRASMAMTLQEAKSIARHLGLTLRKVRSGDYRVSFRDGNETTAYYTDTLEEAVNTAVEIARKRPL